MLLQASASEHCLQASRLQQLRLEASALRAGAARAHALLVCQTLPHCCQERCSVATTWSSEASWHFVPWAFCATPLQTWKRVGLGLCGCIPLGLCGCIPEIRCVPGIDHLLCSSFAVLPIRRAGEVVALQPFLCANGPELPRRQLSLCKLWLAPLTCHETMAHHFLFLHPVLKNPSSLECSATVPW